MIRIGTQGWSYKDWLGNFYPENCSPSEYLKVYTKQFDTVEIDSTFYAIPHPATVENWYSRTPKDFKFTAKFPRLITHESDLIGVEKIVTHFLSTISILNEKLGPLLIQFPYSFKPDMGENLYRFLKDLPKDFKFVVEIRNRKWLSESFYDNLKKLNISLAILDHPWMPVINEITGKTIYVRFLGDRKKITDDFTFERTERIEELTKWKEFLDRYEGTAEDYYVFFNNHYSGHSPTTARRFREMINRT